MAFEVLVSKRGKRERESKNITVKWDWENPTEGCTSLLATTVAKFSSGLLFSPFFFSFFNHRFKAPPSPVRDRRG
jgi:hypothetical protein